MLKTKITLQKMQFYIPKLDTTFCYTCQRKNKINFAQEKNARTIAKIKTVLLYL